MRVALSASARRFVQRRVVEALTHAPVVASHWHGTPDRPVPHIDLAEWADAVLLAPGSATTISRIATGDHSDTVSALVIATRAPVLVAPSMNEAMLLSPSVTRNLATLAEDGFSLLRTVEGIEVAERPAERRRRRGAAPAPQRLVDAFEVWWSHVRTTSLASAGRGADWDRAWRTRPECGYAWESEDLPGDVKEALLSHAPPPAMLCDAGAGNGAQVIAAAVMGYRVIALDRSAEAVRLAAARPGAERVVFLQDDVTAPRVSARFDVLLDRGTFHVLTAEERTKYAAAMSARLRRRGVAVFIHDAAEASPAFATARLDPEDLARAWPGFSLIGSSRTTLRRGEDGCAWLTVLRADS